MAVPGFGDEGEGFPGHDHVVIEAFRNLAHTRALLGVIAGIEAQRLGLVAHAVLEVPVRAELEALHLVASAEVHLAYQAGGVSVGGEVPRPGHVLGEDDPVVSPGRATRGVLGRQHAHAGGCAGG